MKLTVGSRMVADVFFLAIKNKLQRLTPITSVENKPDLTMQQGVFKKNFS